jgi:hypothetical protein
MKMGFKSTDFQCSALEWSGNEVLDCRLRVVGFGLGKTIFRKLRMISLGANENERFRSAF